eukprot:gene11024-biopygen5280
MYCCVVRYAMLCCATLCCIVFYCAMLCCAELYYAIPLYIRPLVVDPHPLFFVSAPTRLDSSEREAEERMERRMQMAQMEIKRAQEQQARDRYPWLEIRFLDP